jgi:rhodanese-related sulfurtransferase
MRTPARACSDGLGIDATKEVVAYDQGSGMYAARLWWMLRSLGHEAAAVLDGGFAAWTREGRPVTTEIPEFRGTRFVARGVPATIDAPAIAANLATPSFVLLDARARERYRGDVEPLDPVAGHIPGALNRPYLDNLGPDGRFKPAAALATEFDALLAGRAASDAGPLLRVRRHRLSQPPRDDARGARRSAALSGLVERVVLRPAAARGTRRHLETDTARRVATDGARRVT